MKQAIRAISHYLYVNVVKPLLFRFQPDGVHHGMVALTKWMQRIPGLRNLPQLWSYRNDDVLAQEIEGVTFRNPVGLSAGFDKQLEMPRMIRAVGFGWMTGGSVTWGKYKGNDGAWYYRLPKTKSLVVNAGLPSEGTEVIAKRLAGYGMKLFKDFPLSVSVAKTNTKQCADDETAITDYAASLAEFNTLAQVKLLEINISCPNTFGGEPFTTPARLEKLLAAVDALSLKKPVFIKMPINLPFDEFDALLSVIAKHSITGVTIGNLHKDRKAVDLKDALPDTVKGNLSGAPARAVSTELIRHTYNTYQGKLVIIGVGGIFTADDAYEKIKAGASLVALITGLIFEGPSTPGQINHDLVRLLKADGYDNIRDAIGRDSVVQ